MSAQIRLEVSDRLYRDACQMVETEEELGQLLAELLNARVEAWKETRDYAKAQAKGASKTKFLAALGKALDLPPEPGDRIQ